MLYVASAVIIILGTMVIFTFEPCLTDDAGNLQEGVAPQFCHGVTN